MAVIGVGNMGKNHARVYYELNSAELVAIADISQKAKEIAKKYKCKYYKDYKEMIRKEKLDAVSIAVPTSLHYKVAKDCIEMGINILIEKPITANLEEAEELIKISKDVVLMVGHIERFNPAVIKLKDIIKKRKIGEIVSIIARRVGLFPKQINDTDVFLDLAVHDLDIFTYLHNTLPKKIYASSGRGIIEDKEDNAIILAEYESSVAVLHVNWITPVKIRSMLITGDKGYCELDYISQRLRMFRSIYEKDYGDFGDFIMKFSSPVVIEAEIKKEEPLKLEIKHFLECVEKSKKPIVGGEEGYNALKLALLARKACRSGEIIKVV